MTTKTKTKTSTDWIAEAQEATAPQIPELVALLKEVNALRPQFEAPAAPPEEDNDRLDGALVDAWRKGDAGRDILDSFDHPWFENHRRPDWTFTRFVRARARIEEELTEARLPTAAQIEWLNERLQETLTEAREHSTDLNVRAAFAATYAQLSWAWHSISLKITDFIGNIGRENLARPEAFFSNAEAVSRFHRARVEGLAATPSEPWSLTVPARRGEWILANPEASPWLPTPDQLTDKREQMAIEIVTAREERTLSTTRRRPVSRVR